MNNVDESVPRSEEDALADAVERALGRKGAPEELHRALFLADELNFVKIRCTRFLAGEAVVRLVGGIAYIAEPEAYASEGLPGSASVKDRFEAAVRAGWDAEPRVDYTEKQVGAVVASLEDAMSAATLLELAIQGRLGFDPTAFRPQFPPVSADGVEDLDP